MRKRNHKSPEKDSGKVGRSVAVTGIGVVSSIGCIWEDFKANLFAGTSGIVPVTRFDTTLYKCKVAAEINAEHLVFPPYGKSIELKRMDLFVKYALCAAWQALEMSNDYHCRNQPGGAGLLAIGVGMGGLPHMEMGVERQRTLGPRFTSPYLIPSLIPNMASGFVARALEWNGIQTTIVAACASGTVAIGDAVEAIRNKRVKWALAGGTEAVITPITWSGFEAMHALTGEDNCRPFDTHRSGMVPGEAAVMLVLESIEDAIERDAPILGVVSGYGKAESIKAFVNPDPTCMQQVISTALYDADVNLPDGIIAQACGLIGGDKGEMEALRETVGNKVRITGIKGQVGHTFAASGPLNVIAAIASFAYSRLPRIVGLQEPDYSSGPLDYCLDTGYWKPGPLVINSYGFGGIHAALVVSPP
jgi:3-oxoacyl-[acyl-carrier-protein] synthase II